MSLYVKIGVPALIVALLIVGIGISFKVGYAKAHNVSWQQGYDKGHSDGLAEVAPRLVDSEQKLGSLRDEYNTLADDYNELRNNVTSFVSTSQYQAARRISCTSNSIGSYTYTNCY